MSERSTKVPLVWSPGFSRLNGRHFGGAPKNSTRRPNTVWVCRLKPGLQTRGTALQKYAR